MIDSDAISTSSAASDTTILPPANENTLLATESTTTLLTSISDNTSLATDSTTILPSDNELSRTTISTLLDDENLSKADEESPLLPPTSESKLSEPSETEIKTEPLMPNVDDLRDRELVCSCSTSDLMLNSSEQEVKEQSGLSADTCPHCHKQGKYSNLENHSPNAGSIHTTQNLSPQTGNMTLENKGDISAEPPGDCAVADALGLNSSGKELSVCIKSEPMEFDNAHLVKSECVLNTDVLVNSDEVLVKKEVKSVMREAESVKEEAELVKQEEEQLLEPEEGLLTESPNTESYRLICQTVEELRELCASFVDGRGKEGELLLNLISK